MTDCLSDLPRPREPPDCHPVTDCRCRESRSRRGDDTEERAVLFPETRVERSADGFIFVAAIEFQCVNLFA
jgi:hypothetical protein